MPYPIDRQINTLIANIKFYISILISNVAAVEEIEEIKKSLVTQLEFINSDFAHTEKIDRFSDSIKLNIG